MSPLTLATGQTVLSVSPPQNALAVSRGHDITATFSFEVDPASANSSTFVVHSTSWGRRAGTYTVMNGPPRVTFHPDREFDIGERIVVTLTRGIRSPAGDSLTRPYAWTFFAETTLGTGQMPLHQLLPLGSDGSGAFDGIAHTDIDHDGYMDLVEADPISHHINILRNESGNGFAMISRLELAPTLPYEVTATDLNNDGYADLIVLAAAIPTITTWLNDGAGNFLRTYEGSYGGIGGGMTSADLNGDGFADLAVLSGFYHETIVFFGDNLGNFVEDAHYPVSGESITHGDYNGDGTTDIAIGGGNGSLHVLVNDGGGQYALLPAGITGGYTFAMAAADMNGDGHVDLIFCNRQERSVSVGINNGIGVFTLVYGPTTGYILADVAVGDMDADGDVDVVASASLNSVLLFNDGTGRLAVHSLLRQSEAVTIADFNNDGDLDVALASNYSDDVAIYRNNNPLVLVSPLNDVTVLEDSEPLTLVADLYSMFHDPDSDHLLFTAAVDAGGITISTASDSLVLFTTPDSFGVYTGVVVASDSFFSAADTMVVTVLPVNDAPHPPVLISPAMGDTISARDRVRFLWHKAFDAENDSLTYTLRLLISTRDSVLATTTDTSFALSGGSLAARGTYSWYVASFDGEFSAWSDTLSFSAVIPNPRSFALHQNFPNPFNPETAIRYDLPSATHVALRIYNALGQEIKTLVHEHQPAGEKFVVWNGTNNEGTTVGSGMYICRIQATGFSASRKCMLLR